MRIIISPAKKMKIDTDTLAPAGLPVFLEETRRLMEWMRRLSFDEAKALWKCNDKIAEQNYRRFQEMDLRRNLTPAVTAYEGIQYQYMAPAVFGGAETDYIQEHLRILSGFYGVLKPFDGVVPYRLEMQAKGNPGGKGNLYDFWKDAIYGKLREETDCIVNLASKEYSRCVEDWLTGDVRYISCVFGEEKIRDDKSVPGKKGWPPVVQKGTQAKMARGEMVRFAAQQDIRDWRELRGFNRLGYEFREEYSSESQLVFVKKKD